MTLLQYKKTITLILTAAMLGTFMLPSAAQAGQSWCNTQKRPKINVRTATDNITYDYSKSEKDLNHFSISTKNPYGDNVITDVGGLMQGGIETTQNMNYGTITNGFNGQVCYWIDTIDVTMHISPTIYIASNFPKGSCMHNAIMAHEQKHIATDRMIVNKYAAQIGAALQTAVNGQFLFGPVAGNQQDALQKAISDRLQAVLASQLAPMKAERMQRQQEIDSLSEYKSVQAQCGRR